MTVTTDGNRHSEIINNLAVEICYFFISGCPGIPKASNRYTF